MPWFWLSFADPNRPDGFLGVAIVEVTEADNLPRVMPPDPKNIPFMAAVQKTFDLGINPGGEVRGIQLSAPPAKKYWNRLIQKPEVFEIGEGGGMRTPLKPPKRPKKPKRPTRPIPPKPPKSPTRPKKKAA